MIIRIYYFGVDNTYDITYEEVHQQIFVFSMIKSMHHYEQDCKDEQMCTYIYCPLKCVRKGNVAEMLIFLLKFGPHVKRESLSRDRKTRFGLPTTHNLRIYEKNDPCVCRLFTPFHLKILVNKPINSTGHRGVYEFSVYGGSGVTTRVINRNIFPSSFIAG